MGGHVGLRFHLVRIGHTKTDDPTGLAGSHAWRDSLRKIENRVQIAVEHLVPALDSFFEEIDSVVGAGSVNEHIDFAPGLFDLGHQVLRRNRVLDWQRGQKNELRSPSRRLIAWPQPTRAAPGTPNVLIVVLDDTTAESFGVTIL